MQKHEKMLWNILTLFGFYLFYIICCGSSLTLLDVSALDTIGNLCFYTVFFFFVVLIFNDKCIFSELLFGELCYPKRKTNTFKVLALLVFQILFEIGFAFVNSLENVWLASTLSTIFDFLYWLIVFVISTYRSEAKIEKKNLKYLFFILLIISLLNFVVHYYYVAQYSYYFQKYLLPVNEVVLSNITFEYGFFRCIYSILTVIAYMCFCCKCDAKPKKNKGLTLARIIICIFAFFTITSLKYILLPKDVICDVSLNESKTASYDGNFDYNKSGISVWRKGMDNTTAKCYGRTKISICYNAEKLKSYFVHQTDHPSDEDSTNSDIVTEYPPFTKIDIGESKVYLFERSAICFLKDGSPEVVHLKEINGCKEYKLLTLACRKLLEDGNVDIFEYCVKYMYKYDESFITPFVDRYSECDFTEAECNFIAENRLDPEFIKSISKLYVR